MYIFKDISQDQLDDFNISSPKGHLFQWSKWAEVKGSWKSKYIGGFNENSGEIVLSALLLTRKLPGLTQNIGYIPRGFVCDYSNKTLLTEFFSYMQDFMKKNKIAFITIDPDLHHKVNDVINPEVDDFIEFAKSSGLKISPSTNFDSIQPGTVFRLDLPEGDREEVKKALFSKFNSTTKRNIKTAISRGLSVEVFDASNLTHEVLDSFHEIMEVTGKRDNFVIRHKNYFLDLIKRLAPNTKLYMIKYDYAKDYEHLSKKITDLEKKIASTSAKLENNPKNAEKLSNTLADLERQLSEVKDRVASIEEYKDKSFYLSGAIYIHYGSKAWYLYGASHDILRNTMPNCLMQWAMIQDSVDAGCDMYDFRGTPKPDPTSGHGAGLYNFKKGYGGDFVEFAGEIYLIRSNFLYFAYKNLFPKFKQLRVKLRNR